MLKTGLFVPFFVHVPDWKNHSCPLCELTVRNIHVIHLSLLDIMYKKYAQDCLKIKLISSIIKNKHKTKGQQHILSNINRQIERCVGKPTKLWSELHYVFCRLDAINASLCPSAVLKKGNEKRRIL